jgi:hypothetical protein
LREGRTDGTLLRSAPDPKRTHTKEAGELMRRFWPYLYFSLAAVSFICNTGLTAQNQGKTNVDWIFISLSFLVSLIFPTMAVSYARYRATGRLPAPSLSRGFVGGWWTDPWQCLLLTVLLGSSCFFGSLFTLSHASDQGTMIVWWKGSITLGLIFGSVLAHKRYQGKSI